MALNRIRRGLAGSALFLCLAAAIACTQTQDDPQGPSDPNNESSATTPAPANTSTKSPKSSSAPVASEPKNGTCIGKAGFTFDDGAACDTCMSEQGGCCDKLVACFKDDPQCAALQKCIDDCSGTGGGTGGGGAGANKGDGGQGGQGGGGNGTGGGGGDGGGGGGHADAGGADAGLTGRACKDACKVTYAGALTKWNDYQTCITTTCKAQCQ
jgi:hypothetical protein